MHDCISATTPRRGPCTFLELVNEKVGFYPTKWTKPNLHPLLIPKNWRIYLVSPQILWLFSLKKPFPFHQSIPCHVDWRFPSKIHQFFVLFPTQGMLALFYLVCDEIKGDSWCFWLWFVIGMVLNTYFFRRGLLG